MTDLSALREELNAIFQDIRLRLRLVLTRGSLKLVYPRAANKMRTVQVSGMTAEASDRVEHAEPFGLAAEPLPGAEPFLGAILGQRGQLVALVISDPRGQPTGLSGGEVVLWSPHGQTIWLKADGSLAINAPGDITVDTPKDITLTGRNITLDAQERLTLRGRKSILWDVHGKGYEEIWLGGLNWHTDYYNTDAETTSEAYPTEPPAISPDEGE